MLFGPKHSSRVLAASRLAHLHSNRFARRGLVSVMLAVVLLLSVEAFLVAVSSKAYGLALAALRVFCHDFFCSSEIAYSVLQ